MIKLIAAGVTACVLALGVAAAASPGSTAEASDTAVPSLALPGGAIIVPPAYPSCYVSIPGGGGVPIQSPSMNTLDGAIEAEPFLATCTGTPQSHGCIGDSVAWGRVGDGNSCGCCYYNSIPRQPH